MQIGVFIVFAVCVLWILAVWPGKGRRERMQVFSRQLIAHRGLHNNKGDAPENSLAAFKLAVEAGYGIELDVRETKDEQLVICHDDNLKRVAGVKKKVSGMSLKEVKEVSLFQSREHIPTFEEALSVIGGRVPLIVEVKSEDFQNVRRLCTAVASVLDSYEGTMCMESFNPAVVRWFRKNRPETLRGQLSDHFRKHKFPDRILMFLFSCCFFNFVTKPDFIAYRFSCANLLRFRILHDFFHACCAGWTIRSEEDLQKAAPDFDVIIFDSFDPRKAVRDMNETSGKEASVREGLVRKHMEISGIVTGVGFRYRAVNIAHLLGVTGWVRNVYDTLVEMELQGKPAWIDDMMKKLREQRFIEITEVKETVIPVIPDEYEFKVRY